MASLTGVAQHLPRLTQMPHVAALVRWATTTHVGELLVAAVAFWLAWRIAAWLLRGIVLVGVIILVLAMLPGSEAWLYHVGTLGLHAIGMHPHGPSSPDAPVVPRSAGLSTASHKAP